MELITILTPVYNRHNELRNLFESLNKQVDLDFIWMIIDDGSTDNLRDDIKEYEVSAKFPIRYYFKENGGKHTALNMGFHLIKTPLTFIVDSDDLLTTDAVSEIKLNWSLISSNKKICGISFLRGNSSGDVIGTKFPYEGILNLIDMNYRYGCLGDKAEVWRSDLLRNYQFPVFDNEKFQGENYIWWQLSYDYDLLFVNKIIYITEYLDGGLTKSGRNLRIKSPFGGMENSRIGFNKKQPIKNRIKCGILFNCYAFFGNVCLLKRLQKSDRQFLLVLATYIPGLLVHLIWKKKYLDR